MEILQFITRFAAEGAGQAEEAQGIAALGIDWLAILAQAATFLLLFLVIKKFALEKIVATLEARRQTIDDGVRLGIEMQTEKEKLEERIAQALKEARLEADKIIANSHDEAGGVIKAAEEAATRKTDALIAEAHAKIEEDIDKARHDLEKDMRALVAEATEVIVRERLSAPKDSALLDKALAEARSAR